jgi:hypothetical protein
MIPCFASKLLAIVMVELNFWAPPMCVFFLGAAYPYEFDWKYCERVTEDWRKRYSILYTVKQQCILKLRPSLQRRITMGIVNTGLDTHSTGVVCQPHDQCMLSN